MIVLTELKKEIEQIECADKLPPNVLTVIEIARQIDALNLVHLPRDLVFRAAVQASFGVTFP